MNTPALDALAAKTAAAGIISPYASNLSDAQVQQGLHAARTAHERRLFNDIATRAQVEKLKSFGYGTPPVPAPAPVQTTDPSTLALATLASRGVDAGKALASRGVDAGKALASRGAEAGKVLGAKALATGSDAVQVGRDVGNAALETGSKAVGAVKSWNAAPPAEAAGLAKYKAMLAPKPKP
jgi:hypothetical protein